MPRAHTQLIVMKIVNLLVVDTARDIPPNHQEYFAAYSFAVTQDANRYL